MELEAIIGLEIHVEMNTKSKMFSCSRVDFGCEPNTCTDPNDLAFPGALPTVNKQAVINGIRVAHALHMNIDDLLVFDRKNYFYSDLPKGYQITQNFRPLGTNGYLTIKTHNGEKRIGIQRLHLEEDACKQIHSSDYTYLDFNRHGIPLIEIVSEPDIKNGEEAAKYVEKIRSIVTYLGVSEGKMEEGNLRVDLNLSMKRSDDNQFGTKVEIKNINSINNIEKAIDYEIERQSSIILSGKTVKQETRRYNDSKKTTEKMRDKEDSVDYKYFVEPDIVPIKLSKEFIEDAINSSPELADFKVERYISLGVNEYNSLLLIHDRKVSQYFEDALKTECSPELLANWIVGDVQSYLNKYNIGIDSFPVSSENLGELIRLIEKEIINNNQARLVFEIMIQTNEKPEKIIKDNSLYQEKNESVLLSFIRDVLKNNPQSVIDYHAGKQRAFSYLVGQVLKASGGKANPSLTSKLMLEELQRR